MSFVVFTAIILFMVTPTGGYGTEAGVPYGDSCQWCSEYGICREDLGSKEAESAIGRYFSMRGLAAKNMRHKGRFIEADIYRNNKLIDKVIFDRKTGRIRSIY
jgi:hypothetical protein